MGDLAGGVPAGRTEVRENAIPVSLHAQYAQYGCLCHACAIAIHTKVGPGDLCIARATRKTQRQRLRVPLAMMVPFPLAGVLQWVGKDREECAEASQVAERRHVEREMVRYSSQHFAPKLETLNPCLHA